MTTDSAAPIVISTGDPGGIGPEITLRAAGALGPELALYAYGSWDHLSALGASLGIKTRRITRPQEARVFEGLCVIDIPTAKPVHSGIVENANAQATIDAIKRAVSDCQSGLARAICTAPITKKVLVDGAGFNHPGHTEFLADLTGAKRAVMMLAGPHLRVVPATIHIPLAAVTEQLDRETLDQTIAITATALARDFGLPAPRIAVAGLNPHAGEGGLMGREELDWIADACQAWRQRGLDLSGPLPADTMFHATARARYDCAIAMYHDQALIPIKTLDFDRGVNVTLGLEIIRTSPDHGTAYDIADQLCANPTSMIEAVKLAATMAEFRSRQGAN